NLPAHSYIYPRLSPDGSKIAVTVQEPRGDAWVFDLPRGTSTRLTFAGSVSRSVWSPDGKRIAFASSPPGSSQMNLFWTAADGSGSPERLTTSALQQVPEGWAPDGRTLVYSEYRPETSWDIWTL